MSSQFHLELGCASFARWLKMWAFHDLDLFAQLEKSTPRYRWGKIMEGHEKWRFFFLENIIEKYPKITCNQQKSTSTSAWRRARAAPHSPTGQSAVKPNVSRTFHRYCSNWYPSLLTLSLFLKTQNLGLLFSTKVCVGICQSVIWFECENEKCSSLSVPPLDTVELFVEGKTKNSPHFFW